MQSRTISEDALQVAMKFSKGYSSNGPESRTVIVVTAGWDVRRLVVVYLAHCGNHP